MCWSCYPKYGSQHLQKESELGWFSGSRCWPDLCWALVQVGCSTFAICYILASHRCLDILHGSSFTGIALLPVVFRNLVSFRELVLILVMLMLSRTHSSSQDDLWGISFWHSHPGSSFGSTLLASPLPFPTYLKNYPSKQVPYGCIPMSHHLTYFLAPSSTALKAQEAIAATLRRACNCCLGRH